MKWSALALILAVMTVVGCGGSGESKASSTTASTESESTETESETTPTTAEGALALLPPFDVPASEDVQAYRKAALDAFFDGCITPTWGASKATFEKANRKVLDGLAVYAGAKFLSEYSIDNRDFNGCPEGLGPATSFTTYRSYRLPAGTPSKKVIDFYRPHLSGWEPSSYTTCEQTFSRGDEYVAVRACNDSLQLVVKALLRVEAPPPRKLPPRPYGAEYPLAQGYGETPDPTSYEVGSGTTCERISGGDVPSIIIPPAPGIRAEFGEETDAQGFPKSVVVEWRFDRILGDCPPSSIHLTLPNPTRGLPPLSLRYDVRARSGTEELPVLESFRNALVLWATAESFDGARSRTVSVLIRRTR